MSWQDHGPDLALMDAGDGGMLASDGDRDAAVRVLGDAFAEGRLTVDEHRERVGATFAARRRYQLAQLTADLPGPAEASGPAVKGVPRGLDLCLLCALLILCPPAGIAWLLAARRSRVAPCHAPTASRLSSGRGRAAVQAAAERHAEDR